MISILITLFITFVASVSSQRVHPTKSPNMTEIAVHQNPVSRIYVPQFYLDGCTAILQGQGDIYSGQNVYYDTFAVWENNSPDQTFFGYFEKNRGIGTKLWIDNSYYYGWSFNLTFYDGYYVDQKFVKASFDISDLQAYMYIIQNNGTFISSQHISASVSYGENYNIKEEKVIDGQLIIYFVNTETHTPITEFEQYNTNIKKDSLQIIFYSYDGSFSFTTSLFSNLYPISTFDTLLVSGFMLLYVIFSLSSVSTTELIQKVSLGSARMVYISSSYIVLWMTQQLGNKMNFILFIPLLGAFIDWIKQAIFLMKKDKSPCCTILMMSFFVVVLFFVPYKWVNLFPAFALLLPLLAKLADTRRRRKHYLNRFQICNWICASLWMGYFYFYPRNIYLISPQPLLIEIFFGIILFQLGISYLMERKERQRYVPLLRVDAEDASSLSQALIAPSNNQNLSDSVVAPANMNYILGRNNRIRANNAAAVQAPQAQAQANLNRPKRPRRKAYKYTFAAQGEQQEDYTLLTDECAICFDYLLGEKPEKLYKTPCGHIFHEVCLRTWGVKKLDCPCCRKKLPRFKRLKQAIPENPLAN